ncbi:protein kinase domain-containing protein [Roseiconus nitratireducens]|nr:protein kinase [Roseiconus nitratireducens]
MSDPAPNEERKRRIRAKFAKRRGPGSTPGEIPGGDFHGEDSWSGERTTVLLGGSSDTEDMEFLDERQPVALQATSHYEVIEKIARGGMGIVYRARDRELNRDVAVKVLRPELVGNENLARRFTNEARVMSFLQHPAIPPIYQCGVCCDGRPYHVMKLVMGETLSDRLATSQGPGTRLGSVLNVFAVVCQTLAYTHSHGVLHLDIKPSNVMVGEFGEIHLMDWGLARVVDGNRKASNPSHDPASVESAESTDSESLVLHAPSYSTIRGTPAYMSPEQAKALPVDTRTDVFGLGATLCKILTGFPPYTGKNLQQVFSRAGRAKLDQAMQRLDRCIAEPSLVRLAKHCLAPNPNDRPTDASEVASEMSDYHESALEQLESDMDRFFELSLDLFCIAGFDGVFKRINSNFPRVLGYTEHDLISRPFIDFVHQDDRAKTMAVMAVLLDGKPVVRFRNRYWTANGHCKTLEWTAKAILDEQIIFAVARDVTE